ncbi:hypothetical protein KIL84_000662 [Mauremys mutica]|uniref:Uncharacterized protein n=1 Tax=Mauremys mutica TaxID=74926 RepID=A0A9D4ANN7_9SAUR|nr:hypothetical protein KIL84_000662 [Mauremys mutica]
MESISMSHSQRERAWIPAAHSPGRWWTRPGRCDGRHSPHAGWKGVNESLWAQSARPHYTCGTSSKKKSPVQPGLTGRGSGPVVKLCEGRLGWVRGRVYPEITRPQCKVANSPGLARSLPESASISR